MRGMPQGNPVGVLRGAEGSGAFACGSIGGWCLGKMEGQPDGILGGGGDAVSAVCRYDERVTALQRKEFGVRKFQGRGAAEEGDPLVARLVIPKIRRTGFAAGNDAFEGEATAGVERENFFAGAVGSLQEVGDGRKHGR